MKLTISFIASMLCLASYADTISNPDYEWCVNKSFTIKSVERTPEYTVLNLLARWAPHYWVMADSTHVIVDRATGKSYQPIRGEGITLGEKFWMPDSGEAEFSLIYPALPPETVVVDFNPSYHKITGLRLDGKKAEKLPVVDAARWQADNLKPYPGEPSEFYRKGTAKLTGVISGYTRAMGFDNMLVYARDVITGKDVPVTVPVCEDGTFSALIPLSRPGMCTLSGPNHTYTDIYMEPGRDLAIYMDWDAIMEFEINNVRNLPPIPFILHYGGSLGEINRRLADAPVAVEAAYSIRRDYTPSRAAEKLDSVNKEYSRAVEDYISRTNPDKVSATLLRKMVKAHHLLEVCNYELYRGDLVYLNDTLAPSLQEPFTTDFFKPLKEVMTDKDEWLLAAIPQILHNRIYYCGFFDLEGIGYGAPIPITDNGLLFLRDKGVTLEGEAEEAAQWIEERLGKTEYITQDEFFGSYMKRSMLADSLAKKNNLVAELEDFRSSLPEINVDFTRNAGLLRRKTEALQAFSGIDYSPLIWQETLSSRSICVTRELEKDSLTRASQFEMIGELAQSGVITNPFIRSDIDSFMTEYFDERPYALPDTEAGRLVKSIIAPHLGKYILIDFWGTFCGPCRYNIEDQAETRRRNRDNPDVKYLFITGSKESPLFEYKQYVAKNLADEESHYLSDHDYSLMRELFSFDGIPRYVLVGPDGMILDDNFVSHNLRDVLEKAGKKLF